MVNPVNTGGYQAYSYQQATVNPLTEVRAGENRIQLPPAPASDSQRADQRDFASRDRNTGGQKSNDDSRGSVLDVTA